MHPERWLEDVGASMQIGRVADQAVLVLAKTQARGVVSLQEADRQILQQAIQFLENAKNGYDWLDQPTVSSGSRSLVSSFSAAVRSVTPRTSNEAFILFIEQMLDTLRKLATGQNPPGIEDRLRNAREFFRRLASEAMDSAYNVVNRSPSPGLSLWNPVSASLT
jgi:hypothetical protein